MKVLKRKELYYIIHRLSNSNSDKRELTGDTVLRNVNNILRNVNVSNSREMQVFRLKENISSPSN